MVEPMQPLQGGQFHGFPGFPGAPAVNPFGLVQPVDGLGVALAADRGSDAGFGQAFRVPNGQVLRPPDALLSVKG